MPQWVTIALTALTVLSIYQMGREHGKRDAWADAKKIGGKVADELRAQGVKIIPEEQLKYIEQFDKVEFPTDKRSIN